MSMKIYTLLLVSILLVGATSDLSAQSGGVYDIRIRDTAFSPIKLGINQIEIDGEATAEDSLLARRIENIIAADLDFHFVLDTVMIDPFILKVYEVEKPDLMIWKYMKADHVLDLKIRFSDEKIRLTYSLSNLRVLKESASDSYRLKRMYWRHLAHTISDAVVERLTGYEGIFRTRLVYVTAKTGNKEIYLSDYDGSSEQPVTANGSINISPVWDAENDAIIYTSYKHGKPDLWAVDLKDGEHEKIASYPGINSAAAISPTNKEMALTLSKDGNAEIYLADRNAKVKRRLTHNRSIETSPAFLPSGRELAFTSDRTGGPQIYIMDTEGLNVRRITFVGRQNESPAISPDGSKIAYVTRSERGSFDICVAEIDGSDYKIITNTGFNENPRWAPDGLHLVYSTQYGDRTAIYISDFMGINRRLITNEPGSSNPCWSGFLY
ncbi:MAG: Tol-Pal system beta propeller repeat protein TolB [candidate division Zixibacteria bacterium]|nr:Tol-Pal system beta propeller repeat protein TolB [candidate division Zixibacteria bacterium]